jgi:hypothetical protein
LPCSDILPTAEKGGDCDEDDILLAPLTLAISETGPGGAGWKLLTVSLLYLRGVVLFFGSNQLIFVGQNNVAIGYAVISDLDSARE